MSPADRVPPETAVPGGVGGSQAAAGGALQGTAVPGGIGGSQAASGVSDEVGETVLPLIEEPASFRESWWSAERRGDTPPDLVAEIAAMAWAHWDAHLPGVDAAWVATVVGGYRRELWLWLVGERTWEQALTGLAGRIRRRLPG